MGIRQDGSTGNSTSPDETDEFLQCRMTIVGLDNGAIERDYPEALAKNTTPLQGVSRSAVLRSGLEARSLQPGVGSVLPELSCDHWAGGSHGGDELRAGAGPSGSTVCGAFDAGNQVRQRISGGISGRIFRIYHFVRHFLSSPDPRIAVTSATKSSRTPEPGVSWTTGRQGGRRSKRRRSHGETFSPRPVCQLAADVSL